MLRFEAHECSKCNRGFATKSNLYRHSRRCDLKPGVQRRHRKPSVRPPQSLDAQELVGSARESSEPQPAEHARTTRYPLPRSDSDESTEDSLDPEYQEETSAQTPSTSRASSGALQKHASSSTIRPPSFSIETPTFNQDDASYPNPHTLGFPVRTYPADSPNSVSFPRRTPLDCFILGTGDTLNHPLHTAQSNPSFTSLVGQGRGWDGIGSSLTPSEPLPSSPQMSWGAQPQSTLTYGHSFSPVQEARFVRRSVGFSGSATGCGTATVAQNPTYGVMPTPSIFPSPQQQFGSHTRGNDVSMDPSSWTNGTFQFDTEIKQGLTGERQLAPNRRGDSMCIGMVDEGTIPAAPTPRHHTSIFGASAALKVPGASSPAPPPAPSPASSIASSSCSAGSGSIAPSMLSLSPPFAPQRSDSPLYTVTGTARERGKTHARTNSSPAAGAITGNQRARRNALYTLSAPPPPRSSMLVPPPIPALYDPIGPSSDPCLQVRPSSVPRSGSTGSSISSASSAMPQSLTGRLGGTNEAYLFPSPPNQPSAAPHYPPAGSSSEMMDLNSCVVSLSSRTGTPYFDPPPGPPPPSGQFHPSRFDTPHPPAF